MKEGAWATKSLLLCLPYNNKMKTKYLLTDLEESKGITLCDNKNEVIEACGYDPNEITFKKLCIAVEGIYDIVKIKGDFEMKWLVEEE